MNAFVCKHAHGWKTDQTEEINCQWFWRHNLHFSVGQGRGGGRTGTQDKRGWMGRVWEVGKERVGSGIPNVEGSGKQIRKTYTTLDININFAIKKSKKVGTNRKGVGIGIKGLQKWEVWIPCPPPPYSIQKSKIHTHDLKKGNALWKIA